MKGLDKAASGDERAIAYVAWGNDNWLPGWAAVAGAVDLSSGQQAEPPSQDVRKLLDDLNFAGNNGWYDEPGKRDARHLLGQLDEQVSRDFTIGAMLAMGHSVTSVTDLRALQVRTKIISGGRDTSRQW
jgi:hypothetical protein